MTCRTCCMCMCIHVFLYVVGFIDRFVSFTKYIFVSLLWNMAALKVGPSYLVAFQHVNPSHSNRSIFGTGCWICSIWSLSRNWWQVLFRTIVGFCTSEKMCYRLSLWLVLLLLLFLDLFTVFFYSVALQTIIQLLFRRISLELVPSIVSWSK